MVFAIPNFILIKSNTETAKCVLYMNMKDPKIGIQTSLAPNQGQRGTSQIRNDTQKQNEISFHILPLNSLKRNRMQ